MRNLYNNSYLILFSFFYSTSLLASNTSSDTLIVRLGGNNQVRVICNTFDDLYNYSRADSLIALFVNDIQKTNQNLDFTEWPQISHYLVNGNGKRRMKIQSNEFSDGEFNLEKEKYRLDENLPSFHYVIYDLTKSVELHLFLESPEKLSLFQQFSLDSAISKLKQNKKTCNRSYSIEMLRENEIFKIGKVKEKSIFSIIYAPEVSINLIGGQLVPSFCGRVGLIIKDKYANPVASIAAMIGGYAFYKLDNGSFKVDRNACFDFRIGLNVSKIQGVTNWFGFEGGIIKGKESNEIGFKGQGFRFSMFKEFNSIGLSFGIIRDANKTAATVIGMRLPF